MALMTAAMSGMAGMIHWRGFRLVMPGMALMGRVTLMA
tara:strand:+ start:346 stop:459 length:114 start_codon:yes stop_codon:yes gene_type:complete